MSGTNLPDALKLADQLKSRYGNAVPTSQAAAVLRDQAGRIADLTTKEFDLAAANAALLERVRTLDGDNQRLEAERDELRARLDAAAGQEPVAWSRKSDAEWMAARGYMTVSEKRDGDWCIPLYATPVPAKAVPDGWRLLAWAHEDGRVIGAETMETARRDGGATLSSVKGYTIPLYAAPEAAR